MTTLLPVVLFDDIVLWATGRIRELLLERPEAYTDNVVVSKDVPLVDDGDGNMVRPTRLVTVRRDGGPRLDAVREAPRLGINVWAEDDATCADLARMTAALLWASPDGDPVCKVTQNAGPIEIPEDDNQPHLYMTFELIAKGRDAA